MLACCGIDCGTCPIGKAGEDSDFAEELAQSWREGGNAKAVANWFKCQGCHGDGNLIWSDKCPVQKCCKGEKKIDNCSICDEFPCELVKTFENDGHQPHAQAIRRLRAMRDDS